MIDMLYSTVGIIVAAGYLPQIIKLLKSKTPCSDISLPMWSIWIYTSSIGLLYSLYGQEIIDVKFVAVNAINIICTMCIIGITICKRRKYKQKSPIMDNIQNNLENAF